MTTYLVAAPAKPVAENVLVRPLQVAVSVLAPAVVPRVQLPTVAMPEALVVAEAPVTEPPPAVAAKVTVTPGQTLLCESLTITLGAVATAEPTVAVWLLPAFTAIDAGGPATVVTAGLVPVLVDGLVLVTVNVYVLPLVLLVVYVAVTMPLAFVVVPLVRHLPPVPVLLQVTLIPEVATALPYWSASCAVMVIRVPATGP